MKFIENTNNNKFLKFVDKKIIVKNTNPFLFSEVIKKLFIINSGNFASYRGLYFYISILDDGHGKQKLVASRANLIDQDVEQFNQLHNYQYEIIDVDKFEKNMYKLFFYNE